MGNKCQKFVENMFGELLGKGWKFVRILALYNNKGSIMQNVCPKCRPYILTNSTEDREIQQMKDLWMEISGIVYPDTVMMKSHSGKDDFRHVFSRLIGFSSMTLKIQKIGAHQQIMGTYAPKIVGGWTKASKLTYGKKNEPIRYGDVIGR